MTEQTIPADQVREIVEKMYHHANHDNVRGTEEEYVRFFARQFDELLPAPPLPTLADMTPEERDECQWMQADVAGRDERYVITRPYDEDDDVVLISDAGGVVYADPARVTPRPDLPRLEWPGDKTAPTGPTGHALPDGFRLAEHPDYGRVIVTTPDPGCDGDVYFVYPETVLSLGFNSDWCDPADLTYLDQGADQ